MIKIGKFPNLTMGKLDIHFIQEYICTYIHFIVLQLGSWKYFSYNKKVSYLKFYRLYNIHISILFNAY